MSKSSDLKKDYHHNQRMRDLRADAAEIEIPEITDIKLRRKALRNPIFFAEHCCPAMFRHKIPPKLQDYCRAIVDSVKTGKSMLVVCPRGSGKTSCLQAMCLYCIAAGMISFPVIVACSQGAANAIIKNILTTLETSESFNDLFPEICTPFRALAGLPQRCAGQHVGGVRTNIRITSSMLHFADLNGKEGATIIARGQGGSVRGLLSASGNRPDFVFTDDPQKSQMAKSSTQVDKLQDFINSDLRGLAGGDKTISIFVAATPIAAGDIVDRLSRDNSFATIRYPLVSKWPDRQDLWDEFRRMYMEDLANETETAIDFYKQNREDMDAGAEVLDPLAFPKQWVSAICRAYILRLQQGESAFNSEYQLTPKAQASELVLDPKTVSHKLSLVPQRIAPMETSIILAGIDVGALTATKLHVSVIAFGRNQVASIIDAFTFPPDRPIYPKGTPAALQDKMLATALVQAVNLLLTPNRYRSESGKSMTVSAIAIDRGYKTVIVDQVANFYQRKHVQIFPIKGYNSQYYYPSRSTLAKGEEIDLRELNGQRFLAQNSDHFKYATLSAFLGEPLQTGSLSLWGDDPGEVYEIAAQICGEKLAEKFQTPKGQTIYRWVSFAVGAQNHYLDSTSMTIALATFLRYRDVEPIAIEPGTPVADLSSPSTSDPPLPRKKKKHRIKLV